MKIKIEQITTILEYLILLCFIFGNTMATWRYEAGRAISPEILTYVLYVFVVSYVFIGFVSKKFPLNKNQIILIGCFFVYSVFYSFFGRDMSMTFWMWFFLPLLLMMLFCFGLRRSGRVESFFLEFSTVVTVLAFISVVLYFGGEVLHIIHSRSVTVIRSEIRSYSIPSYYGLMYIGQTQTVFGTTFARNTGIFLEGPSWGSFLWPAFFAEVLVRDKIKKCNCLFLILAVITSFSLKGIVFCLAVIGIKYVRGSIIDNGAHCIRGIRFNYKIALLPLLLGVIGIIVLNLFVSKSTYEEGSIAARLDDTIATVKAWKHNPLFGCGFNNEAFIRTFMSGNKARGNTAGLFKVFALGGMVSGLEYIYGIFKFIISGTERKLERASFGMLLIINLCISSTYNSLFALFFVALGLSYIVKIREPQPDYE